jgi:DNA-binding transcriptional regulator YiaG
MADKVTGAEIQAIMTALDENRREFARRLEVSEMAVYNWLTGKVTRIHPRNLKELNKLKRKHLVSQL